MNHGSLFSGIGGFDLAAEWMQWNNVFHCEKEKFCQQILKYYWPDAALHEDITKTDFTKYKNQIDILSGGFPCQPFSNAGERKGTADDRYLWPEMLRAISEIKPRWIVGENVYGLVNWNSGLVLDTIKTDLENLSYEVFPPVIIPACGLNAPHRRYRVWVIAHAHETGLQTERTEQQTTGFEQYRKLGTFTTDTSNTRTESMQRQKNGTYKSINAPNAESIRMERGWPIREQKPCIQIKEGLFGCNSTGSNWSNWPTQSPFCIRNDGFPNGLDGITFSKWRQESIKGAGNAIVPQIAFEIFKTIEAFEKMH